MAARIALIMNSFTQRMRFARDVLALFGTRSWRQQWRWSARFYAAILRPRLPPSLPAQPASEAHAVEGYPNVQRLTKTMPIMASVANIKSSPRGETAGTAGDREATHAPAGPRTKWSAPYSETPEPLWLTVKAILALCVPPGVATPVEKELNQFVEGLELSPGGLIVFIVGLSDPKFEPVQPAAEKKVTVSPNVVPAFAK